MKFLGLQPKRALFCHRASTTCATIRYPDSSDVGTALSNHIKAHRPLQASYHAETCSASCSENGMIVVKCRQAEAWNDAGRSAPVDDRPHVDKCNIASEASAEAKRVLTQAPGVMDCLLSRLCPSNP